MIKYIKENYEDKKQAVLQNIKGASLLTREEYRKHLYEIPYFSDFWWLKDPGYSRRSVCGVNLDRKAVKDFAALYKHAVRPVLILQPNSVFNNMEDFKFGGEYFKIISDDLAICYCSIGEECFNKEDTPDVNIYENSDLKMFIDDWFNQNHSEGNIEVKYDEIEETFSNEDWGF